MKKKFFNGIRKGAGPDLTLTRHEAYKWGSKHSEWFHKEMFDEQVRLWLEKRNYVAKQTQINVYLNPEGAEQARKVVELENYLDALMAGRAVTVPDSDKVPYYLEFSILIKRFPEFLSILEKHPDSCNALAERLGCSKEGVIPALKEARLTFDALLEGVEKEIDEIIEATAD